MHTCTCLLTVVDCSTLTNPANGQVSNLNGTTFGQTATYSCNAGYTLVGCNSRICQATGEWSWSQPTCQRMLSCTCTTETSGWFCKSVWIKRSHSLLGGTCSTYCILTFRQSSHKRYNSLGFLGCPVGPTNIATSLNLPKLNFTCHI